LRPDQGYHIFQICLVANYQQTTYNSHLPSAAGGLIPAPFFQICSAKRLHGGDVLFFGNRQQGVVEKVFPVDVAAEDVAGPAAAAEGVGGGQAGVPAAAVGMGVGHVADHAADVGPQRQLDRRSSFSE